MSIASTCICGKCAYFCDGREGCVNNQNNPQEVPQVKSVERLLVELQDELYYNAYPSATKAPVYKEQDLHKDYFPLHMVKTVCERHSHNLQYRVAELEAGLKQCQKDRDEADAKNDKYREALEEINEIVCDVRISSQPKVYSVIRVAEQALNPKDNG